MAGEADVEQALRKARSFPGLAGMDLAKVVTTQKPYEWAEGRWQLGQGYERKNAGRFHVVACDYGVKHNILRMLVERAARVTVVPAQTSAREILRMKPDGVFLSNGPGDPEPCDYAIEAIGEILDATRLPVFGICLGHQLMGLASGAKTMKMKFGHHGANHPVKDLDTGRWSSPARTTASLLTHRRCPPIFGPRMSPCLMGPSRALRGPTGRRSAFRGIPKRARDRTTSAIYSTASPA
jgi:carbamoyl-phosphate synthase small subunit